MFLGSELSNSVTRIRPWLSTISSHERTCGDLADKAFRGGVLGVPRRGSFGDASVTFGGVLSDMMSLLGLKTKIPDQDWSGG